MRVLGIILARAGSKGLPDKCVRILRGRAVIEYTIDHARSSKSVNAVVLSTDSEPAKELARRRGIEVIDRPAELADDAATVDDAARHAVAVWESRNETRVDAVVLLYGNIPVRAEGLIDRAVDHLIRARADSVRSVARVTKQHPDWIHRLEGDRLIQFRPNSIYRRQDLEPLYYHDGAAVVVMRDALFRALETPDNHQAFWGKDRRAIVQEPDAAVDIDGPVDFHLAEALLRARDETAVIRAATARERTASQPPGREIAEKRPIQAAGCDAVGSRGITIKGRTIGEGSPVFIIAEAGVNHDGSLNKALQLVDAAADAGADAVKFQMFRAADLVSAQAPTASYQRENTGEKSQRELLQRLELSADTFAVIRKHCDQRSILFLATPFGECEVDQLVRLGVGAIKIASTDLNNEPLLARAAETGLPILLSTGASSIPEVKEAVSLLSRCGASDRLLLFHCISRYPTPDDEIHLKAIPLLRGRFTLPVGLSDHTTSPLIGGLAIAAGACMLEKHITLNGKSTGPDHAMSLNPGEFAEYVRFARLADGAMGLGDFSRSAEELAVRDAARKSIVAAVDIPAGSVLRAEWIALRRPGLGLSSAKLPEILGKTARIDIPGDTPLTWDMVR